MKSTTRAVSTIGAAQIISSAAGHYLPAVISVQAAQTMALSTTVLFAGFSWALVVSAMVGPWAGRLVDRLGGRPVLMLSNVFFIFGLLALGASQGIVTILLAYSFMGAGMAMGQFEVAFAALVKLFGKNSRNPITGITLIAGFASFVGWTLSVYVESLVGWRGVCWFWAAIHLVVALPLHALVPKPSDLESDATSSTAPSVKDSSPPKQVRHPSKPQKAWVINALLSYVFAASSFIGMGLMMHMPDLLQQLGVGLAVAFTIGSLVGPSQVLGRLIEYFFMRRWHPLVSTRLAALCHPVASALLIGFGAPVAAIFVILHGIGNGILIISRGTLPLAIFGTSGYGKRQGWLMLPAKLSQAAAPFLFGMALTAWGPNILWMTWAIAISVFIALCLIKKPADE